ncbi:MAG: hypothetical protein H0X16_08085 [Chloroflexi bacterium]|nr:hypothetical protein [Chloroflexota bacterium]
MDQSHPATDNPPETLYRIAFVCCVVFVVLGTISDLLFVAAFQFRVDWFMDPALAITGGEATATLLRWAALTDLLSYYLPMAPIALALRQLVRHRDPGLADLATLGALGYVIAGGIGAAALAWAAPELIRQYAAGGPGAPVAEANFRLLFEIVFRAIWQTLDGFLLTAWFLGLGSLLRHDYPRFATLNLALGVIVLVGTPLNFLGFGLARDVGAGVIFVLWFAWGVWLAVLLRRDLRP